MISVILFKTTDCEACNIMVDILMKVAKAYASTPSIRFIILNKDHEDTKLNFFIRHNITKFPTIIVSPEIPYKIDRELYKSNKEEEYNFISKDKFTYIEGTVPYVEVTRAIEKYR